MRVNVGWIFCSSYGAEYPFVFNTLEATSVHSAPFQLSAKQRIMERKKVRKMREAVMEKPTMTE